MLVPLIAYVITRVISLAEPLHIGLISLATAAGAPFLPKLVQVAKGDIAFGVGLMALLMVVTIIYMPIVLPLLLPGVHVDPWAIAQSLILLMLIPLGIALFIRAQAPETAATYQPVMNKSSSLAILIVLVVGLGLNVSNMLSLIGTGGILALLLFIIATFAIGFVLGLHNPHIISHALLKQEVIQFLKGSHARQGHEKIAPNLCPHCARHHLSRVLDQACKNDY